MAQGLADEGNHRDDGAVGGVSWTKDVDGYLVPHCLAARAVMTRWSRTSPTECLAKAIEMMRTWMAAVQRASCSFCEAVPFMPQHRTHGVDSAALWQPSAGPLGL
eukprot:4742786-Heterocapsa_arctica.AAC.1